MNHNFSLVGFGLKLRPIALNDAENILTLRLQPGAVPFLGRTENDLDKQKLWISRYLEAKDDFYFAAETNAGEMVGTISVYNQDGGQAEWGRWVLKLGVQAAPASVALLFEFAFLELGLARLYCRTLAANTHVVSFHDGTGARRIGVESSVLDGKEVSFVVHEVTREQYPAVKVKLESYAKSAERFLSRM